MLKREVRTAILELARDKGLGTRTIARLLKISRGAVKGVLAAGTVEVPMRERHSILGPYRERIIELHRKCGGNRVRVHEELRSEVEVSYQALTAYCREEGIGATVKVAAGRYEFAPGQELQHDTSPHKAILNDTRTCVQSASAVLCFSRMIFFQASFTFTRFDCKIFLTDALMAFAGAPAVVLVDNTSVVVGHGSGAAMVPAPEMEVFGERYGFVFRARELGDVNRSGRVERPFHFIENNFFAGRRFADIHALNAEALAWCERVNSSFKRHMQAVPRDLFVTELAALQPLPLWVPEVVRVTQRTVDVEGFVTLHTNRYSVPEDWIGRRVEVRESKNRIEIELDQRTETVVHARLVGCRRQRVMLAEHRRQRKATTAVSRDEQAILAAAPEFAGFVSLLKNSRRPIRGALGHLLRMVREYPREPLARAINRAFEYGLVDMHRVERLVLHSIAGEFFQLGEAHE